MIQHKVCSAISYTNSFIGWGPSLGSCKSLTGKKGWISKNQNSVKIEHIFVFDLWAALFDLILRRCKTSLEVCFSKTNNCTYYFSSFCTDEWGTKCPLLCPIYTLYLALTSGKLLQCNLRVPRVDGSAVTFKLIGTLQYALQWPVFGACT